MQIIFLLSTWALLLDFCGVVAIYFFADGFRGRLLPRLYYRYARLQLLQWAFYFAQTAANAYREPLSGIIGIASARSLSLLLGSLHTLCIPWISVFSLYLLLVAGGSRVGRGLRRTVRVGAGAWLGLSLLARLAQAADILLGWSPTLGPALLAVSNTILQGLTLGLLLLWLRQMLKPNRFAHFIGRPILLFFFALYATHFALFLGFRLFPGLLGGPSPGMDAGVRAFALAGAGYLAIFGIANIYFAVASSRKRHSGAEGESRREGMDLASVYGLTQREIEVVGLILKGFLNKEISRHLGISENTVKNHLYSAYRKLSVNNRAGLLRRLGSL